MYMYTYIYVDVVLWYKTEIHEMAVFVVISN